MARRGSWRDPERLPNYHRVPLHEVVRAQEGLVSGVTNRTRTFHCTGLLLVCCDRRQHICHVLA